MTYVRYQPPERQYADTMLAFKDFELASTWGVQIDPDPLGPVNKIVTLMRGSERVKSALARVPEGADVRLVRDTGGILIPEMFTLPFAWRSSVAGSTPRLVVHMPGWHIEVNDRTVLTVEDTYPPRPAPPRVPLWQRMRQALREQVRTDADRIAKRLGYCREGECGGDW